MSCGIYQIRNTLNNKVYVGSSKKIEKRWERHLKDLRDGKHHNIKLQRAFNKYGEDAFVLEIVEEITESILLEREQYYLDNNKNGYNIGLQASGGDNLTNNPNREEIIKRMTEGVKKAKAERTEEQWAAYKQKITGSGNPNYGKRWSKELREEVGKIVHTRFEERPELKDNASECMKNMWRNEEYRNAQIERAKSRTGDKNSFFGKKHTEATKNKLRESRKNKLANISYEERKRIIPNMRKVKINGVIFDSLADASKSLNILHATIWHRIHSKNPKFSEYEYVD